MGLPAVQAEAELARNEPVLAAASPLKPLGADMDVLGHIFSESAFYLGLGFGQVKPSLRQFFDTAPVHLASLVWAEKAVTGVFIVIAGNIVNLAWGVFRLSLPRAPDGVVFLPAVAAKMHWVELGAFFLSAGGVALRIQRNVAHALSL